MGQRQSYFSEDEEQEDDDCYNIALSRHGCGKTSN